MVQLRALSGLLLLAHGAVAGTLQDDFKLGGDAKFVGDRVVLASGKNQVGSVWTKAPVKDSEFTLETVIYTKAGDSENPGKAGYTLWYTDKVVTGEVHGGADKWDGLAVMVDSLGKRPVGAVRGHLNDNSYKFTSLGDLDADSLSLCNIDFRQISSGITVRVAYAQHTGFVVDVNGQRCFVSNEITLPSGYYFGITANSDISGDTLAIERPSVSKGFNAGMKRHLPQFADEAPVADQEARTARAAQQQPQQQQQQLLQQSGDSPSSGLTTEDVKKLIDPVNHRLELIDMKLGQMQSVVDQLVDTVTVSLREATKPDSRKSGSGESSANELAALRKEIQGLKSQSPDWRNPSTPVTASSSGTSIFQIILILLPVQLVCVFIYHSWYRKWQSRHEKLL